MKTIREIAKLSGCSTATVSRYINKKDYVSEKTAKKIQDVIDKHDYSPNSLTISLMKGYANYLAIIVQDIASPYLSKIISMIEENAYIHGFSIIVCCAEQSTEKEMEIIEELKKKRVAGLIVIGTTDEKIYQNLEIPLVAIERKIKNRQLISTNNEQGIKLILENNNLKEKKILFVGSPKNSINSQERERYFIENNVQREFKIVHANNEATMDEISEYIIKNKFNLIVCWNDLYAHRIYASLYKHKISIPDAVELIGFDNLALNIYFQYQLTTIKPDLEDLCEKVVHYLIKSIVTKEVYEDIKVGVSYVKGTTTK